MVDTKVAPAGREPLSAPPAPSLSQASQAKDDPVVTLTFKAPADREVYDTLAGQAKQSGTHLEDDLLAILCWFVQDFSGGRA